MARGFGTTHGSGSTDKILTSYTTASTGIRTYSAFILWHGLGGGSLGRFWDRSANSTVDEGLFISSTVLSFGARFSTTAGSWTVTRPSVDVFHHVMVTYDSTNFANDPSIWVDGVSQTVTETSTPAGLHDTTANAFCIGNRSVDSARNLDGKVAEFAVWDGVAINNAEVTLLSHGYSPLAIRPDALVVYEPMLRANVSPIADAATITGTAVQNHPRITRYRKTKIISKSAAVAAGSDTGMLLLRSC